jgi:hypothetical protein
LEQVTLPMAQNDLKQFRDETGFLLYELIEEG